MKSNNRSLHAKVKKKGFIVLFTVLIVALALFAEGLFHGRFNFRYEKIEICYSVLPEALEGFKIIHISDLHLKSLKNHRNKLKSVIDSINSLDPDIIVNTGDFVTLLYEELMPFSDLLGSLKSNYGIYAIPGNHDTGLYSGKYKPDNFSIHLKKIGDILNEANHTYLDGKSILISLDTTVLSVTGVITYGHIPDIYYGDTDRAMEGTDSADFRILLTHDPNHWIKDIQHRKDIQLTLSGHTHGMQAGILTKKIKLSPARLLFPAWSGLYGSNDNYLYVNRGIGTTGIPARVGMPPEITIITLKSGSSCNRSGPF